MLKRPLLINLSLIGLGLCLRLALPGNYYFAFDQVQILQAAQRISEGDLTLIGPRTGPADMFTGPLIYYLAATVYLFNSSVYSLHLTVAFIFIATALGLWYLSRRYLKNPLVASIILSFWAVSPFIVSLDRVIWNPNLILLAAACSFFPLLQPHGKPYSLPDYLILFLGGFLGYQAHFSGLALPFLVCFIWLLFIRRQVLVPLSIFAGLFVSLLPTFIFDYRHQWHNLIGFHTLLTNPDHVNRFMFFTRLNHNFYVTLENITKLLSLQSIFTVMILVGLFLTIIYLLLKQTLIPIVWLVAVAVGLSFYRLGTPEYYYLIQLPALMYILSQLFYRTYQLKPLLFYLILGCFLVSSLYRDIQRIQAVGHLNLRDQLAVTSFLHLQSQNQPIREIIYQLPPAENLGLEYLNHDITLSATGSSFTVIYPTKSEVNYHQVFGLIGINQN